MGCSRVGARQHRILWGRSCQGLFTPLALAQPWSHAIKGHSLWRERRGVIRFTPLPQREFYCSGSSCCTPIRFITTAFLFSHEAIGVDLPVWIRFHASHLQRVSGDAFLDALCKQYKILRGAYVITREYILLSHVCQLVRSPRRHGGREGFRAIPFPAGS